MKTIKWKGNHKHTGWAVGLKDKWHYFDNHTSVCDNEFHFNYEYIFVPKISRHSEICPQCRKLAKDKLIKEKTK